MRRFGSVGLLGCLVLSVLAGCMAPQDVPDEPVPEEGPDPQILAFYAGLAGDRHVVFDTDHGQVRLHLFESRMPVTTGRFIELVESGFYDGTQVHRNVERFVIQGGDPTGTGAGGSLQNIPHERHEDLLFAHGSLGLARSLDEDSGDSQWFITLTPQPHLTDEDSDTALIFGTYSLFGQVVHGMEVVRQMNQVPTIPGLDRPVEPPVVERARVVGSSGDSDVLLGLPRTITDRVTVDGLGVDVDRPLHVFEGRPFQVGVYLRPGLLQGPPLDKVQVVYRATVGAEEGKGEELELEERFVLRPVDGDPWSFEGTALLQVSGDWEESVRVGDESGPTGSVEVHSWHPEYSVQV